eukprot:m51a1_g2842 putative zinc transporter (343) ;mRNA; f:280729-281887
MEPKQRKTATFAAPLDAGYSAWEDDAPRRDALPLRLDALWRSVRAIALDRHCAPLLLVACAFVAFAVVEMSVSAATNSLGLVAHALHTLFDAFCVGISLAAALTARGAPTAVYSYGRQRFELLAGFANGVFLMFFSLFVVVEALQRVIAGGRMHSHEQALWTAAVGLVLHLASALFFHQHTKLRSEVRREAPDTFVFLVVNAVTDATRSAAVLASSWASTVRGWELADPLASLALSLLAIYHTAPICFRAGRVLLQATPLCVQQQLYGALLRARMVEGVLEVKEEHFWTLAPGVFVGSVVVRVRSDAEEQAVRKQVRALLAGLVSHLTVQVEKDSWLPTFNQ